MKSDMIVEEIIERIKKELNPKRLKHSMSVLDYSVLLAQKHGEDEISVKIGALYHDAYRNHSKEELITMAKRHGLKLTPEEQYNPVLLHGRLAAVDLKKRYPSLRRLDEVAEAVQYHTTGHVFKSKIGKIIFIADSLEKNRIYPGVDELRKLSIEDIDAAFFLILKGKLRYALKNNRLILSETVSAYNKLIMTGETKYDQHS